MRIEKDKFYKDRSGNKVGPMYRAIDPVDKVYPWRGSKNGSAILSYQDDGNWSGDETEHHQDLIEEWCDPDPDDAIAEHMFVSSEPSKPCPPVTGDPAYTSLAAILQAAHDQAASGKGRERHSDDKPFLEQPIMEIARMLGDTGGHAYQIMKKAQEANRMVKRRQFDAAEREALGIINYAAAMILLIREIEFPTECA